jgi:hypothetical protein
MHHQIGIITAGSWFWPTFVVFLVLLAIGFIIYKVSKSKNGSDIPTTLSYEEEMAEIYCPDLLSEVIQLRAAVKKFKGISDK